jgi:AGCS family alanine or glycine:cation symporter
MTVKLKGIQRYTFKAIKLSVTKEEKSVGDVSPFSALMTALAATIGTGNIVGVASAIAAGGPGAILWMWLSGVLGMATKYSESLLSVKYRVKMPDGSMAGGPMYVMERGMHKRWLGLIFAFVTSVAALGVGSMVQANSIASMFKQAFNIEPWFTGALLAMLAGLVIIGGIKSIAKVCNLIIPVMGILFIGCNLLILCMGWYSIPHTIQIIFFSAFSGQAAVGGCVGAAAKEACRYGVSRGLFSNESGLGSEPIVAAAAQTKSPVRQALVSLTGTFWDTVVLAAITGIMIVNSGLWMHGSSGSNLTASVFSTLPVLGPGILALSLFAFAFATIIGWSYYAQKAVEYIFGTKAVKPYLTIYVLLAFLGSVISIEAVWSFADIANAMMALPNLISLIVLTPVIVSETERHLWSGNIKAEHFKTKALKHPAK